MIEYTTLGVGLTKPEAIRLIGVLHEAVADLRWAGHRPPTLYFSREQEFHWGPQSVLMTSMRPASRQVVAQLLAIGRAFARALRRQKLESATPHPNHR